MLLCLARISGRAQPVDQSSGQLFRWPLRVGAREVEIVPSSGVIADASEAVPATIATGADIGMATSFMASGWVRRGALMPVLADYAVERHNITALRPERWRSNPAVRAFLDTLVSCPDNGSECLLLARRCLGSSCQKRP